jgi:hypothetical protein
MCGKYKLWAPNLGPSTCNIGDSRMEEGNNTLAKRGEEKRKK